MLQVVVFLCVKGGGGSDVFIQGYDNASPEVKTGLTP